MNTNLPLVITGLAVTAWPSEATPTIFMPE